MRRGVLRAGVAACCLLGTGACLSRPALAPQTFSIDAPPPPAESPGAGRVLTLGAVAVAPAYAVRSLTYTTGAGALERDPYAILAAAPSALLGSAIRGYLLNAAFVRDVVPPGTGVASEAKIEVYAAELVGDLAAEAPAAVLVLRFRVVAAAESGAPREILLRTYSKRPPLVRRTASAVVAGWSTALAEIMGEFEADLKTVLDARL